MSEFPELMSSTHTEEVCIGDKQDFLWGAGTSSHQVEGGTHNQWSEWEHINAETLARTAPERCGWLPSWPDIQKQATDPNNYISGDGVQHYSRYREDFAILGELGMNAFRFSIEWSRVQPTPDAWDQDAIMHYHNYIRELKKRGIEPILTLWHWTMPTWFTDKGGFEKRKNLTDFDRYVARMAEEFGHEVRYVLTLNEPNMYAFFGYLSGEWPPQQKNPINCLRVYRHLMQAHRRAYVIMKRSNPVLQIGIAAQLANNQPLRPKNTFDTVGTAISSYISNWWYLDRIKRHQDFIGLNYYYTNYFRWLKMTNPKTPLNDMGWYMEPSGIGRLITAMDRRYKKPIMITENGLPDAADKHRQWWLMETMTAMDDARTEGACVIGYLYWSLVDNFEWNSGWWPKFGLAAVDREDRMRRTLRPSARWLAAYIKRHTQPQT